MPEEKRSIFDQYEESWTEEASELGRKIHAVLRPIFKEAAESGIKIREIGYIAHSEADMITCEMVVHAGIERRKQERLNKPCSECGCAVGHHDKSGCLGSDDLNPGCPKECKRTY